jgi:hypothetical protein
MFSIGAKRGLKSLGVINLLPDVPSGNCVTRELLNAKIKPFKGFLVSESR